MSPKQAVTVAIVALCIVVGDVSARVLTQCQVARELLAQGMPRNLLNDWVCLVLHESDGNTAVIGGPNGDGSYDYGLFQINDRYWCQHGWKGKGCNVECKELIANDITVASRCAKLIYGVHGFNAWYAWKSYCSGGRAPSVDHCF